MVDTALRARVNRLLSDDFRIEDLSTLFLALRERCVGMDSVIDIGDFIAHRNERNRGLITRSTRDFFIFLRSYSQTPINLMNLPNNFPEILRAAFRRIDNGRLRQDTTLKRQTAERALNEIIPKIRSDSNGHFYVDRPSQQELSLITCLMRHLFIRPAFDEDRLFKDYSLCLINNGLLARTELNSFRKLKGTISLYAISCMHEGIIDLGDGTKATLSASANCGSGTIGVLAKAEVPLKGKVLFVSGSIFSTTLKEADCCEPSLLGKGFPTWTCHLELTPRGMLGELSPILPRPEKTQVPAPEKPQA